MKIFKIVLIGSSVLALFIFLGILIFLQFFDINKYLPQITTQVSQSIGRQVNVNHANLSFNLLQGLTLDLKIVTISDQLNPGGHDFIVVDNAHLALDLTALLFKREVRATDIRLSSIQVNIESYHLMIQEIRAKVNNFSLNKPFNFNIDINTYSKGSSNIEINGQATLDLSKNSVRVTDLNIKSNLSQWDWAKVRTIAPVLKESPVWLLQDLKGNMTIGISSLIASAKGVDDFQIQWQGQIGAGALDGKVDLKGVSTNLSQYDFTLNVKGIKLQDLLDQRALPVNVTGALTGQFSGSGSSFDPNIMQNNLKGQGNFELNDTKIEHLNILKTVLDKLNFIPGLGNILQGVMPSEIISTLGTDTTVLEKAQTNIKIADKVISIDQARLESKTFSISAQGTLSFDLIANINVDFYLDSDVSTQLTKSARPLQALLDGQKRLYIPGKVSGKAPSIGYLPQMDQITKKVITSEGSEQLSQQLDRVLEKNPEIKNILNAVLGENKDQSNNNDSQDQDKQGSSKKLINNILKDILH